MPPPLTRKSLRGATIQRGRIVDVDTSSYTCSVMTEFSQMPLTWVTWASPYENHDNGEGIYVMPEVGSICWLVEPSDGHIPFILGWTSLEDSEAGHRNRKQDLNPGDIYMGTRDENHLWLRRGGVVEIGATPMCQRLYLPVDNIIRDFCENYLLQTVGGSMEWSVGIPQKSKAAKQQTQFVMKARQFADDAWPIAQLQIGSHSSSPDTILSLVVNDSGDPGAKPVFSVNVNKTGSMTFGQTSPDVAKKIQWDLSGNFEVKSAQSIWLKSLLPMRLESETIVDVSAQGVSITALTSKVMVKAKGGMAVLPATGGPALTVGAGTTPVLLATQDLLNWIQTHTHECTAAGSDSKTPKSFPTNITSQDIKTS
jgi:hypothetical protein